MMGCIGSRETISRSASVPSPTNSTRQTLFTVQNVNDRGQGMAPGQLEVTETDLVLHVKGKPSLVWPLRSLRRYGFDNDLFSFESGRRCHTGAGIFAFRCERAQFIFNLLQSKVQGNSPSIITIPCTPIIAPTTGIPFNIANATRTSTPASSTFVYVNLSENNSSRLSSVAGGAVVVPSIPANAPPPPPPHPPPPPPHPPPTSSEAPDVVQTPSGTAPEQPRTSSSASHIAPGAACEPSVPKVPQACADEKKHPVYMNVESHGGALYSAKPGQSYRNNPSNIPPRPRYISSMYPSSSSDITIPPTPITAFAVVGTAGQVSVKTIPISPLPTPQTQSQSPLYSNVFCYKDGQPVGYGAGLPPPVPMREPAEINYAELDLKTDDSPSSSARFVKRQTASSSGSGADEHTLNRLRLESKINAVAAINKPELLAKAPLNQNNGDLGYATIDFDKTAELHVTTRSKLTLGYDTEPKPTSKRSKHVAAL